MINKVARALNISHVFYPNPYAEHPESQSQCNSPQKDLKANLYLTSYMQAHAKRHGLLLTSPMAAASSNQPPFDYFNVICIVFVIGLFLL